MPPRLSSAVTESMLRALKEAIGPTKSGMSTVHYTTPDKVESLIRSGWNPQGHPAIHTRARMGEAYGGPETVPLTTPGSRWRERLTNQADLDDWDIYRQKEANRIVSRFPGQTESAFNRRSQALDELYASEPVERYEDLVPVIAEIDPGLNIDKLDSVEALREAQQRTGAPEGLRHIFPSIIDHLKKDRDGFLVKGPWELPDKRTTKRGNTDWFDEATGNLDSGDQHIWKPGSVRFKGVLDPQVEALWKAIRKTKS